MKPSNYLLCFSSSIIVSCLAVQIPAQAQISADDSLSMPTEVVQQSDNLIEILGGTEAGINLFHSFAEFSVPEEEIARFINNNLEIYVLTDGVYRRNNCSFNLPKLEDKLLAKYIAQSLNSNPRTIKKSFLAELQ